MPTLSEPTIFCSFPSITNNYDDPHRVTKRRRSSSHDPPSGKRDFDENEGSSRAITKRARVVDVSDVSGRAHVFHKGYEHGCVDRDGSVLSSSSRDVANFLTILLGGLNKHSQNESLSSELIKPPSPFQRRPTSPLAQSPYRQPFVRKQVGGHLRGRVEPSLQRWVLYQNHIQDIRSCPPHYRSAEWIETLHEMGWENLHPSYALDVRDIFIPSEEDSEDDFLEVDIGQYTKN